MTRAQIQQLFVAEFHAGEAAERFVASDIPRIESELATVLPQSYITFMQTHGSVFTPSLLSLIVDGRHAQWDVQQFLQAAEVIEDTRMNWSGDMSNTLVCFAYDSGGNLFCFRRSQPGMARPEDAPVWFFDHEFCDDFSQIAESFDDWLFSYLKLKRQDLTR
jgi:hypothetical protein